MARKTWSEHAIRDSTNRVRAGWFRRNQRFRSWLTRASKLGGLCIQPLRLPHVNTTQWWYMQGVNIKNTSYFVWITHASSQKNYLTTTIPCREDSVKNKLVFFCFQYDDKLKWKIFTLSAIHIITFWQKRACEIRADRIVRTCVTLCVRIISHTPAGCKKRPHAVHHAALFTDVETTFIT